MSAIVVLGDELHGVGFHLAGVEVRCPRPETVEAEFAQALGAARLILLSPSVAAALPAERLRRAQRAESPLVVVLPDLAAPAADAGFARRLRSVLGIEA